MDPCDLLLTGARVLDPETGLDQVRNVAITGERISAVTTATPYAAQTLDLTGLILAPGFIDLHSHAQTISSLRMQAHDGVTTALELESGAAPVAETYAGAAARGRPINYGYAASWAMARMRVLDGVQPRGGFEAFAAHCAGPRWRQPAGPRELDEICALIEAELNAGALGIGVLLGYAPASGRREYVRLAQLAQRYGVPAYTHARFKNPDDPGSALEGVCEVVSAALGTGAHLHLCHLNSTSLRAIDEVSEVVARARTHGVRVSTEAYPYGAGMTTVGADFLAPEHLGRMGIAPSDLTVLATGEHPANADRLAEIRAQTPGAMVAIHYLDENDPREWDVVERALLLEDTAIASDAIAFADAEGRLVEDAWPLPSGSLSHPRTAGTFGRFLRTTVREAGILSPLEAVRRCSLLPAQAVQNVAPQLAHKARVQAGADADLVVFDPALISDRASYANSSEPTDGVIHLLVGGEFLIRQGQLQTQVLPGQAIYGRWR